MSTTLPFPSHANGDQADSIGLLLSGGLDSAILLHRFLEQGWHVQPFYVRSGCVWQPFEQRAVKELLAALATPNLGTPSHASSTQPRLAQLVELDMPVDDLYAGHWSMTGQAVPDSRSPDEAVFLPGRNPLLLMKPALWCVMHGISGIGLATLSANPFDDATPEFFARFEAMIEQATGYPFRVVRPFETLSKRCVMKLGQGMPLELTFSCLAPVGGLHCGRCNKCAERASAFANAGMSDPTKYAAVGKAVSFYPSAVS
jgi:7-cyano-7-deazaguanine synthase